MNLCSENHEEVCYEGRTCPVCDAKEELGEVIDTLRSRCNEVTEDLTVTLEELAELQEIVDTNDCTKYIVKKAVERCLQNEKT